MPDEPTPPDWFAALVMGAGLAASDGLDAQAAWRSLERLVPADDDPAWGERDTRQALERMERLVRSAGREPGAAPSRTARDFVEVAVLAGRREAAPGAGPTTPYVVPDDGPRRP
jgi:hypothetical protein